MVMADNTAAVKEYTYDAGNRLVSKTLFGTIRYVYNGPQMIEEYMSGSHEQSLMYGQGVDDAIVRTTGPDAYYVKDMRSSITGLVNASGAVIEPDGPEGRHQSPPRSLR